MLSLMFAFNGIALAAARNPHFEMLVIGTGMMFLVALVQERYRLATLFFALCLATREDAGFDLFALLAVTVTLNHWRDAPLHRQKYLVIYGVLALAYSTVAIIAQRRFFPGDDAFTRVYLGTPLFDALTWRHITERLDFYMSCRLYILMPGFIAFAWGISLRDAYIAAGYIAFIPWFLLHLLANSLMAGTLSNYYAFPFIFALFWPLIGLLIEQRLNGRVTHTRIRPLVAFTLMLMASFVDLGRQHNPGHLDFPVSFLIAPSLAQQQVTDAAVRNFAASKPAFGVLAVDGSIAALDPNQFNHSELLAGDPIQPPDSIIFFAQGYQAPLALAVAAQVGLKQFYEIPRTHLRVATDRQLDRMLGLVPIAPSQVR
jgi:hypothetical protein